MKIKRFFKRTFVALFALFSITKIFFEIDSYAYETTLITMIQHDELPVNISSTIEHKTLELDECSIHYFVSGRHNKNTIVFLHPAFSDHTAFDQQVDHFSTSYKVITIDLIGHGLSKAKKSKDKIDASADHIHRVLELENVENAHLVGVSIGSLIAQHFALCYPAETKSLTALGGYNINVVNKEVEKSQRGSNIGLVIRALFSMKAFRKKTALITCSSARGQGLFYQTTRHYERKSFMVMQGLQNIIADRSPINLPFPTLIMVGESDIELSQKMARDWHSTNENSQFLIIKDAGHSANIDQPQTFNEALKTFIEKIEQ